MIGHASIFVETKDARILMDPVLWDPFCEGLNETCPKREVIAEKLPEYDFLVISHQHLDHFDLRTLAYLPKNVDVIIPKDTLIADSLRQLGYSHIYTLGDFQKIRIGSTTLMTTRSEVRVPEFGMVFADSSGVFWNTVDTYFAPHTIQIVKNNYPQIDFLLSTWHISLETNYQCNKNISFPFELYGQLMNLIQLIEPKAIAPGAQGWKYIKEAAWQNQIVFPVTRERFCHDIKQTLTEIGDNIFVLDPGDIFTLNQGEYHLELNRCDYVKKIIDDRECLEFTPVKVGANFIDSNPEKYDTFSMKQAIDKALKVELSNFINEHKQNLFFNHQRWHVIYQLEIIYPEKSETWHIDFSTSEIQVTEGRNPLANLFSYITASGFYNIIQKKRDWDYLYCSGEYRNFHKVYSLTNLGILTPPENTLLDPITLKYSSTYVAGENIKSELSKMIESHQISSIDNSEIESDYRPMLNLGNILIKVKQNKQEKQVL
ncbi:MAG: MBL fold metallo-hydrolase [Cyanobacteria bacterium J06635_10]